MSRGSSRCARSSKDSISSTGETLRANHLKILEDGLILKSQATLFRARRVDMSDADRATLRELMTLLSIE